MDYAGCTFGLMHYHVGETLVWVPDIGELGTVREDGTLFVVATGVYTEAALGLIASMATSKLYTMV